MTWASEMVYSEQQPRQDHLLPEDPTQEKTGFGYVGTKCAID